MSRDALLAALSRMDLLRPGEQPTGSVPLSGGVSSDIMRVDLERGSICVKRALPRLRVEADWRAPIERNRYEAGGCGTVGAILPDAVPRVLGDDRETGMFAMPFLEPVNHPVWKAQLRDGTISDVARAMSVPHRRDHPQSHGGDPGIAAGFATDQSSFLSGSSPIWRRPRGLTRSRGSLADLVRATSTTKRALVHGDVSPKNILVGPQGPVFLDAECAWYGDPAFDLAFCLNHLLLKCLWRPQRRRPLPALLRRAGRELPGARRHGSRAASSRRARPRLLPGLLLWPGRRQVAGRVPRPRRRTAERVRRVGARAAARTRVDRWRRSATPGLRSSAVTDTTITSVRGRRVWDSRGRPTVEAEVRLASGATAAAIAPAGASSGSGEAVDLRDGGTALRRPRRDAGRRQRQRRDRARR